jgi:hypothetical protein
MAIHPVIWVKDDCNFARFSVKSCSFSRFIAANVQFFRPLSVLLRSNRLLFQKQIRTFASKFQIHIDMRDFKDYRFEDFRQVDAPKHETVKRVRASFYRTKPGCYTPPRYKVDCIKLSEVL